MKKLFTILLSCCLFTLASNAQPYEFADVVTVFSNNGCTGCHGSQGGLNLSDYNNVVNGGTNGMGGCGSYADALAFLVGKVDGSLTAGDGCGSAMPTGTAYGAAGMPAADIAIIQSWIDDGAPEFLPANSCPTVYLNDNNLPDLPDALCVGNLLELCFDLAVDETTFDAANVDFGYLLELDGQASSVVLNTTWSPGTQTDVNANGQVCFSATLPVGSSACDSYEASITIQSVNYNDADCANNAIAYDLNLTGDIPLDLEGDDLNNLIPLLAAAQLNPITVTVYPDPNWSYAVTTAPACDGSTLGTIDILAADGATVCATLTDQGTAGMDGECPSNNAMIAASTYTAFETFVDGDGVEQANPCAVSVAIAEETFPCTDACVNSCPTVYLNDNNLPDLPDALCVGELLELCFDLAVDETTFDAANVDFGYLLELDGQPSSVTLNTTWSPGTQTDVNANGQVCFSAILPDGSNACSSYEASITIQSVNYNDADCANNAIAYDLNLTGDIPLDLEGDDLNNLIPLLAAAQLNPITVTVYPNPNWSYAVVTPPGCDGAVLGTIDILAADGVTVCETLSNQGTAGLDGQCPASNAMIAASTYTAFETFEDSDGVTQVNPCAVSVAIAEEVFNCVEACTEGCTDTNATNFDPAAAVDDGSCQYLCADDNLLPLTNLEQFGESGGYGVPGGMGLAAGTSAGFGGFIWSVPTSGLDINQICMFIDMTVTGDAAAFPITLEFRIENNACPGGFPCPWYDFNTVVNGPGTYTLGGIVGNGTASASPDGAFDPDGANPAIVAAIANFGAALGGNIDVSFSNLCVSDGNCITTCEGGAPVGSACDDGDNCTENDVYQEDCSCLGTLIDINNDGICDNDQILGCTDMMASNFFPNATADDGSCLYLCNEENLLAVSTIQDFNDGSGLSYGTQNGMGLIAGANNAFGGFIWDVNTAGLTLDQICLFMDMEVTGDASAFPITLEFRVENGDCGTNPCPSIDFNLEVFGPGTYTLGGLLADGNVGSAGTFDPNGANTYIVAALANFSGTPTGGNVDVVFSNLCVSDGNCLAVFGCTDPCATNYNPDATDDDGTCMLPEEPATACYETATYNGGTCTWEISGDQPEAPATACYETATFNDSTCMWDVTGDQPEAPATACYETATFNDSTCMWDITGDQPEAPATACYETATFNDSTCMWDITGDQPEAPATACYETATFNDSTCMWDVTGEQPAAPTTACYETATFNDSTCMWDVSGEQPAQPTDLACYETVGAFDDSTCMWQVSGEQPNIDDGCDITDDSFDDVNCVVVNTPNCPEGTSFNSVNCSCDTDVVTGCTDPCATNYDPAANSDDGSCTLPEAPATACYETASFNTETCMWEVSGDQPEAPATACYETATFNGDPAVCAWEVSGDQPEAPAIACYETAAFNGDPAVCAWEVSGEQPTVDDGCDVTIDTFDEVNCVAVNTPDCPEGTSYNSVNCSCDTDVVTGCTDPCATNYDPGANSDDGSCSFPAPPATACYETASFNTTTCMWDVTGEEPVVDDGCDVTIDAYDTETCEISNTPDCPDGTTYNADNCACDEDVVPCEATAGMISSDVSSICIGGSGDIVSVTIDDAGSSESSLFVITDGGGTNILATQDVSNTDFDLTGAPAGTCQIWLLNYDGEITLPESNLVADLEGCFALSNAIDILREECTDECDGVNDVEEFGEICEGDSYISEITGTEYTASGSELVLDANDCAYTLTVTLTINTPPANTTESGNICSDGSNSYISNDGTEYVSAGTYDEVFTDANGCTGINTVTVNEINCADPCETFNVEYMVICDDNNFSIAVTITGGSGSYLISDGTNDLVIDSEEPNYAGVIGPFAAAESVSFTVTDQTFGCSSSVGGAIDCTTTAIELLAFEANVEERGNALNWTTATENENAYFMVMKSLNGVDFTEITQIEGAGFSSVPTAYNYLDEDISNTEVYYRLDAVDFNGIRTSSEIVRLTRTQNAHVDIYPIPAINSINVDLTLSQSEALNINVYDVSGKIVDSTQFDGNTGLNEIDLDISNLSSGLYFISIDGNSVNLRDTFIIK